MFVLRLPRTQERASDVDDAAEGVIPKPLRQKDCTQDWHDLESGRDGITARPTEGAPAA